MNLKSAIETYLNPKYLRSEKKAQTLIAEHKEILACAKTVNESRTERHTDMSAGSASITLNSSNGLTASGAIFKTGNFQNLDGLTYVTTQTVPNNVGQQNWGYAPQYPPDEVEELKSRVAELERRIMLQRLQAADGTKWTGDASAVDDWTTAPEPQVEREDDRELPLNTGRKFRDE